VRGVNLQTVRARVERLAADMPDPESVTVFSWQMQNPACPACGVDLKAHAVARALDRARATGSAWVWADTMIDVCPGCGIPHPEHIRPEAAERSGAADAR
jgi:hypothetical protein